MANQANSKLWCISYTGYVLAKEIVSLPSLQLMYSYLNELTLYAHWKWSKQYLLLLLSVVSTLSIVACWRDTQHKHYIFCHDSLKLSGTNSETHNTNTAFTETHWRWNKQCLLSGVSAHMCWRDATRALNLLPWLIEVE